jgi:hypothetical protein
MVDKANHLLVICYWCDKKFHQRKDTIKRQAKNYGHTCCKNCFGNESTFKAARKRVMLTDNPFLGKKHTEETKVLLSRQRIGKPAWNKGLTEEDHPSIKQFADSTRARIRDMNGNKNPNWKGGSTLFNRDFDFFTEWLPFRKEILERDCYSCWKCSQRLKENKLEVHHIVSKAKYPELKYDELNCIVLCKRCHKDFHRRYGTIKFIPHQIIGWLNENRKPEDYVCFC